MTVQGIGHAARDRSQRRLVKDDFHSFDGLADVCRVRDVPGDNLNPVLDMGQFGSTAGHPIIEDTNLVTRRQQGIHQMRSDEAASPGD